MESFKQSIFSDANTSLIMKMIYENNPISRSEIATVSGLAPSTVSVITGKLQEMNFIRECGQSSSTGGRPSVLIEVNQEGGYFIAVDLLKGAKILISVLNLSMKVLFDWSYLIPSGGGERVYSQLVKAIVDVREWCLDKKLPILGIGIASPGLVDSGTGRVIEAENIQWYDLDLRDRLQQEFECAVIVENDTNAATYGEFHFGSERDKSKASMMYFSIDTGIGSGLILNSELYRGFQGMAGEIGHVKVSSGGKTCVCGKKGCLSTIASVPALIHDYFGQTEEFVDPDSLLAKLIESAENGDDTAKNIIVSAGRTAGLVIGNQVNVLNLNCIVLGGSIFSGGKLMFEAVEEGIQQAVLTKLGTDLSVRLGTLGSHAGLIGVTSLNIKNFFGF